MSRFLTKILNEKPGENKTVPKIRPNPDQTQTNADTTPRPDTIQTQTKPRPHPYTNKQKIAVSSLIAPERDFNRRANILERQALPNGFFPGASKAIYDALYLRTLGAVSPKRIIQATRKELMKWSGVKNIKTINAHLKRLKDLSLVRITNFAGEQSGSYYEIFLPEQIDPDQTQTEGSPEADQKMDLDQTQKTVWVGLGKTIENKDSYENPKTSLKTKSKNDDDDAYAHETFATMTERLNAAVEKITGKGATKGEAEKWGTLADLLILELEVAASRTDNISSVPAFLTEVLRRQFFSTRHNSEKINSSKIANKVDTVGKPPSEIYEVKSLNDEEKQEALEQLREFINEDFLLDFKKWYIEEDWEWLMKNLESV